MPRLHFMPVTAFEAKNIPVFKVILDSVENVLNGRVDATNLADDAVETAKLADGAVTPAKTSGGVARSSSGQYTGTGATSPVRAISLGYRPRYVLILRHDNSTTYEALGDASSALAAWWRDSAGTVGTGAADWPGITADGFEVAGASDASGVTFSYMALGAAA